MSLPILRRLHLHEVSMSVASLKAALGLARWGAGYKLRVFLLVVCLGSSAEAESLALPSLDHRAAVSQMLRESSRQLANGGLKQVQLDRLRYKSAPPELRVLVIGCDFADSLMWGRDLANFPGWPAQRRIAQRIPGTDTPMFAAHDSTYFDLQMRRVNEYFRSVSFDRFRVEWEVHPTIVNLPRPMGWYGDSDSSDVRVVALAQEVVDAVDAGVDFSAYDTMILIHAGAGSETDILGDSPEQIPSNYLDQRDFTDAALAGLLPQDELLSDEGPIEHVLVLPEAESQDPFPAAGLSGFFDVLGVYCFEFGLRLGMLSLTDFTPARRPDSQGIGNFGLMGFGLFTGLSIVPSAPSAINRHLMGWVDVVEVRADSDLRLTPMAPGAAPTDTMLVKVPINDREYWLLEYRLQDPNGDLFYSFADSNGDRVPDYWDADSTLGNGWPTSSYDPATDVWESTLDSEWDYFMSENPARTDDRCMRAGGSGVYIYHIDERVIENSILSGVNTINADPDHKGVDVEEADGIQDLDSARPSEFILGWDGDAWRGEGSTEFGPSTVPATDTVSGLPTGIRFSGFSTVVVDSLPRTLEGDCSGFEYRPAMSFRVEFGATALTPVAQRSFSGVAPISAARVQDLGTSGGDPTPDGQLEIVCLADGGQVLAFDGGLGDWVDGDANLSTIGVLAVATSSAGGVSWLGDPVVVDFDGDGQLDVLAAAEEGVYAFRVSGAELLDGDNSAATNGVLWSSTAFAAVGAAVLLDGPSPAWMQLLSDGANLAALRLRWIGGAVEAILSDPVAGQSLGPAALLDETNPRIVAPWSDDESAGFLFFASDVAEGLARLRSEATPSSVPVTSWGESAQGSVFLWTDVFGTSHRTRVPARNLPRTTAVLDLSSADLLGDALAGAPSALVGANSTSSAGEVVFARVAGGSLHALDASLQTRAGFPLSPRRSGADAVTDSTVTAPAMADLDGDGEVDFLWHDGEGALHAVSLDGLELQGWPVAGPAEALDGPVLADLDADGTLEMILATRFAKLTDIRAPERGFVSEPRGELRIYDLEIPSDRYAPVVHGARGPRNQGILPAGVVVAAAGGDLLDQNSVALQPNPAVGSNLKVRVVVARAASVHAVLYNLEGEEVARSTEVFTEARSAFDEMIDISGLSSGMYVCRIVSGSEAILRPFAVAR
jgi:M6 family metalloprotease-like protein